MCGEQSTRMDETPTLTGSSPRVRGADPIGIEEFHKLGIIPACAGSSRGGVAGVVPVGDHPRVCGEQVLSARRQILEMGSSPRVRGAAEAMSLGFISERIIPACAGSRHVRDANPRWCWDHPRVCGEQPLPLAVWKLPEKPGSSPRVRGAGRTQGGGVAHGGIIPACAGSSSGWRVPPLRSQDHPRVCGEQSYDGGGTPLDAGSSPRVRGAGVVEGEAGEEAGIIPACAGSSIDLHKALGRDWDHPRVCGEQYRLA